MIGELMFTFFENYEYSFQFKNYVVKPMINPLVLHIN